MNIQGEYNNIANDLTKLVKDEISRLKLIKTGNMYNSINFEAKKLSQGYLLQMSAVDYFEEVNKKYHIIDNVLKSSGYKNIQERIAKVTNLMLIEELTKN